MKFNIQIDQSITIFWHPNKFCILESRKNALEKDFEMAVQFDSPIKGFDNTNLSSIQREAP